MSRRQKTVFRCLESSFLGFYLFNQFQGIWRSFEPQSSEGKDREGFSHRGAENSYEGAQRARQELRSEEVIKRGRRIILACSCPTYICCPHRKMTGNAFSEILLSIEDVFQTKRRTPRRVPRVLSRSYCGGSTFIDVLIIPNCSTHYCQGFRNSLYGFLGQAEALAVPIAARLDRISEFVRWCPKQ